jgi:hypothetical protein
MNLVLLPKETYYMSKRDLLQSGPLSVYMHAGRQLDAYEEEDTCMAYEEEDTCMANEEEDTCMAHGCRHRNRERAICGLQQVGHPLAMRRSQKRPTIAKRDLL